MPPAPFRRRPASVPSPASSLPIGQSNQREICTPQLLPPDDADDVLEFEDLLLLLTDALDLVLDQLWWVRGGWGSYI